MGFAQPLCFVSLSCSEMVAYNQKLMKEHFMQSSRRKGYLCRRLEDGNENAAWNSVRVVIPVYACLMWPIALWTFLVVYYPLLGLQ